MCICVTACSEHTILIEKDYTFQQPESFQPVSPRRWNAEHYVKDINTFIPLQLPLSAVFENNGTTIYVSYIVTGTDTALLDSVSNKYKEHLVNNTGENIANTALVKTGNDYRGYKTYSIPSASKYVVIIESNNVATVQNLLRLDYIHKK